MSEFNNFGVDPQNNGQNNNSFGSTPGDSNNFGSQNFDNQNFGGTNMNNQNFGSPNMNGQNFGNPNMNGQNFGSPNMNGQNFGGNTSYSQQGGFNYNSNSNVDLSATSLWKTLSIIQIVIGCCGGLIPLGCGIISLIFINKAQAAFRMNDFMNGSNNLKTGKIFNIVGWGIMALSIIGGIIMSILGAFESIFG